MGNTTSKPKLTNEEKKAIMKTDAKQFALIFGAAVIASLVMTVIVGGVVAAVVVVYVIPYLNSIKGSTG